MSGSSKNSKKTKQKTASAAKQISKIPAKRTGSAQPRHGLGRGLGALMGGITNSSSSFRRKPAADPAAEPKPMEKKLEPVEKPAQPTAPVVDARHTVFDVPVAEIERSPWQPRQTFDADAMHELSESIKANGLIQPLVCRKNSSNHYELIAGERRLRAAIDAGLTKVPVVMVDAEDRRAAEMAIVENIQRQDLNAIEEAEGYRTLVETFDLTQQEVADRVGKARPSVANLMRLLELPDEVKQLVGSGLLSTGHAKVLLSLTDATDQTLLGRRIVNDGLTVRRLEKLIARRNEVAPVRKPATPDLPEAYLRDLSDRLHRHFGTAVRITPGMTHANGKHSKGELSIDFYDNDDLDRILSLLGITLD